MWFLRNRTASADEAKSALEDAKKNLRKIQDRSCDVTKVANALKEIRERNHFAEQLEAIISRGIYPNDNA